MFESASLIDVLPGALSDSGPAAAEGPAGELGPGAEGPPLENIPRSELFLTGTWGADRPAAAEGLAGALAFALEAEGERYEMD